LLCCARNDGGEPRALGPRPAPMRVSPPCCAIFTLLPDRSCRPSPPRRSMARRRASRSGVRFLPGLAQSEPCPCRRRSAARGIAPCARDRARAGELVLLGIDDAGAFFALDLSAHDEPLSRSVTSDRWNLPIAPRRPADGSSRGLLLAYARGMMWWHARHRFCGVCGSRRQAKMPAMCDAAADPPGHRAFPRTDPAVIMLVTDGARCLLAASASGPRSAFDACRMSSTGREPRGRVARESRRRPALSSTPALNHSSQPWPFPSSIMLGFTAEARSTNDHRRSRRARGCALVRRDFLLATGMTTSSPATPRLDARRLIEDWLAAEPARIAPAKGRRTGSLIGLLRAVGNRRSAPPSPPSTHRPQRNYWRLLANAQAEGPCRGRAAGELRGRSGTGRAITIGQGRAADLLITILRHRAIDRLRRSARAA